MGLARNERTLHSPKRNGSTLAHLGRSDATPRNATITLDVIVPTFNRAESVIRTLRSLASAHLPEGLKVEIFVVDNNSTDDTAERVKVVTGPFVIHYLFEPRQGKSHALNAGLQASGGDLVGLIDDDEEIDPEWFGEVSRQFRRGGIDFLGGPYFPVWQSPPPAWLDRKYYGLVGSVTEPSVECDYGPAFPGMLMGGNAVIDRATLARVGLFSSDPSIMRSGTSLVSGEDRDMYERLVASGARGKFSPALIVHHHIPRDRVTMAYLRKRLFAHGVSRYLLQGQRERTRARHTLFGVPCWYFSRALLGLPHLVAQAFVGRYAASVEAELNWYELAGQLSAARQSMT